MNRLILFKAKRLDNGEWESGTIIHSERNISGEVNECFICRGFAGQANVVQIKVDPETVCQFTGLTDKHGDNIFEGDKLDLNNCHGQSEVFFKNGSWKINGRLGKIGFGSWAKQTEIIGNIHD